MKEFSANMKEMNLNLKHQFIFFNSKGYSEDIKNPYSVIIHNLLDKLD